MLNINPANAFAYYASVNSDRRLGFRVYDDMLEEKYTYRRPEFLQLNEESEQAASDHESRVRLISIGESLHQITSQDRLLFHTGNYLLTLDTPSKLNISIVESSISVSCHLAGLL